MTAMANDRSFETPEIKCLDDHTISFIESDIPAKKSSMRPMLSASLNWMSG